VPSAFFLSTLSSFDGSFYVLAYLFRSSRDIRVTTFRVFIIIPKANDLVIADPLRIIHICMIYLLFNFYSRGLLCLIVLFDNLDSLKTYLQADK